MNINRHNYEEFFLLYVDGEMSEADKLAVESFVSQHSDLKEELDMLLQVKLLPDEEDVFIDKSALYRTGGEVVSLQNCEEKFLLYIDNELNEQDKNRVETFVLQHPQLQNDFTLLKKTVLTPETIPHPNKEELYRTEKDRKPIIYMPWLRYTAAAAIVGLAISVWFMKQPTKQAVGMQNELALVGAKKDAAPGNDKIESGAKSQVPEQVAGEKTAITPNDLIASTSSSTGSRKDNTGLSVITAKNNDVKGSGIQTSLTKTSEGKGGMPTNNYPGKNANVDNVDPKVDFVKAKVVDLTDHIETPEEHVNIIYPEKNLIVREAVDKSSSDKPIAQQAVYRELNTDDDKSLYVGSLELNKDKLRGLARKVNRLFGKSKTDNDYKTAMASNK